MADTEQLQASQFPASWAVSERKLRHMTGVWGEDAVKQLAADAGELSEQLAESGFCIGGAEDSGMTAIVLTGIWRHARAVCRITPSWADNEQKVVAMRHWAGACGIRPETYGDGWQILPHAGTPLRGEHTAERWGRQLDVLCALADRPVEHDSEFPTDRETFNGLLNLAASRPRTVNLWGPAGFTKLAQLIDQACAHGNRTLVHGDCHDGNWLANGDRLTLIDPQPNISQLEQDLARWTIGAGTEHIPARARLASERGDRQQLAVWLRAIAFERAGALHHHGRSAGWAHRLISAANATAHKLEIRRR